MTRSIKLTRMALAISMASILFTLSSCGAKSAEEKATPETVTKAEAVKVLTLQNQQINRAVEYSSTLSAWEEVHMAPASPGRVEKINVEVGDRVAKGDILAIMDQTQLHQAQIQLKNAETDFNRFDTLQKVGGIARQQYDQVKVAYDIAKSNVQFLNENTRLRAPFSGIVSGKYFENGELYSGAPNATGKAAIVSLVQLNPLKVMVSVSEQYFPQIKRGMEASITCDIYPGKSFTGKVFRIYPTIDASTRTFMVEVEMPNHNEMLRPGMFARVSFELDKVEALLVPALAILKVQGSDERYLFIVEDGKAKRISIKPGKRIDDDVEVISNQLKTGDQIVIFGQTRLMDGTPVTVISE